MRFFCPLTVIRTIQRFAPERPTQHGHRRDHTCNETETSRVILLADPVKNGGITVSTPIGDKMKAIRQVQARFADGRWKTDISVRVPQGKLVDELPQALNKADGKVMIKIY